MTDLDFVTLVRSAVVFFILSIKVFALVVLSKAMKAKNFGALVSHSTHRPCNPQFPPKPLILAGWAYSNDIEKMNRWEETVNWAKDNGCEEIVTEIPDADFYYAAE